MDQSDTHAKLTREKTNKKPQSYTTTYDCRSITDGHLDRQDDESWDPRHDSEFKKILNSLHEQLPDPELRFDQSTKIKMCSRRSGDTPEEKKWFPVFPMSDFIPSVLERVHEVLLDKEDIDFEEDLSHPYSLPSGAKSSQNFTDRKISKYRKKNYSFKDDQFIPEPLQDEEKFKAYTGVNLKNKQIPHQSNVRL